jgi:cell division protein FtsN
MTGPAMTGPAQNGSMTSSAPSGPSARVGASGGDEADNESPPSGRSRAAAPASAPPAEKASAKGESGRYAVQLGAFKSGHAAAKARWEHLEKEYPKLLAGLSPKILPKKITGGALYRVQVVGIPESEARKICKILKAKSPPCVVISPAHGHAASRD